MCANYESDFEEFDEDSMPVPCEKCDSWFELTEGYGSELWFPNTVICKRCYNLEQLVIERRDIITDALVNIMNNEHTLKEWNYVEGEEEEWE